MPASALNLTALLNNFKIQATILACLAFVFYANTFQNGYALDDDVVINKNAYVLEGTAGLHDILTKDAFDSYYKRLKTEDYLKGGRYRPLSMVTFALEQQLFGSIPEDKVDSVISYGFSYEMNEPYEQIYLKQMHIRHLVNIFLYMVSVVVLLYMLHFAFRLHPLVAFVAALIFTIHPIHTEVVANVKSRDEILSFLFICVTFIFSHRYLEKRRIPALLTALLAYFLAFLSKEYAITLIALLPVSFYVFKKRTFIKSLQLTIPYLAVAIIYIAMRWQITGAGSSLPITDIQINPYAFATATQKLATEIATSVNYLKLLLFPHPLSSDYSYNQIPYKNVTDPLVWISLGIHTGLIVAFVYFLKKKNVLSFAIGFYLSHLLMVNNLVFDIGATMGERLIYHSSLGFAIALAYLLVQGYRRLPVEIGHWALGGFLAVLIVLCGIKTIARNQDWKDNASLYFRDIHASPNSFLMNMNVASLLVNRSDYEKDPKIARDDIERAIPMFNKVLALQNTYVLAYMNRGIAYYKLGNADSLVSNLDKVRIMYPIYPPLADMYMRAAAMYYAGKQFNQSRNELEVVLRLNPGRRDAQAGLRVVDSVISATGAKNTQPKL